MKHRAKKVSTVKAGGHLKKARKRTRKGGHKKTAIKA